MDTASVESAGGAGHLGVRRPRRAVLVSRRFGHEIGATTVRLQAYARALREHGFDVLVVTRFPFPEARLADGVRRRRQWIWQETLQGIRVRRLRMPAERVLEWGLDRVLHGFARLTRTARIHGIEAIDFLYGWLAAGWVLAVRPEVIVIEQGPVWLALPVLLCARAGAATVLQISDVKSAAMRCGLYGAVPEGSIALNTRLETWAWRSASRLVTVTERLRALIGASIGQPAHAVELIPNGVELDLIRAATAEQRAAAKQVLGLSGQFVVLYAGTFGAAHDLDTLLGAAARLRADPTAANVAVLLVGEGPTKRALQRRMAAGRLANVRVLPGVPLDALGIYVAAADVGVSTERRGLSDTVRAKLFLYMGGQVPIVATDDDGEVRQLVRRAGAGLLVEPENPAALAAAILRLRDDAAAAAEYARNGRAYAEAHHDRRRLAARFAAVVEESASLMRDRAPARLSSAKS